MLAGARQGILAAAGRLQHPGMKDMVFWLCQGPGCSTCAGAVFCISIYCLSALFPLLRVFCNLWHFIDPVAIAAWQGKNTSKLYI